MAAPDVEFRVNLQGYLSDMPKTALVLSKVDLGTREVYLKTSAGQTRERLELQKREIHGALFPIIMKLIFQDLRKRESSIWKYRNLLSKVSTFGLEHILLGKRR
ncbi:hypothetical protein V8V91_04720 [Algoriphagus halophilus]|uniref:hypothetical protein n=1 Tax=Algoriphagus halophilus TaxID=226505 RepID=UPI00358E9EF2